VDSSVGEEAAEALEVEEEEEEVVVVVVVVVVVKLVVVTEVERFTDDLQRRRETVLSEGLGCRPQSKASLRMKSTKWVACFLYRPTQPCTHEQSRSQSLS
jgi:hypothetical protein